MSVNKAILVGNVGRDPEVRYLEKGVAVANFSLATTERGFTMQNGTEVPDRTEWHNIVVWRGLAELAEKYIRKGSKLYIEGKLQTRSWEKDGVKRYTTEIVAENIQFLDSRRSDNKEGDIAGEDSFKQESPGFSEAPLSATGEVDDLPF